MHRDRRWSNAQGVYGTYNKHTFRGRGMVTCNDETRKCTLWYLQKQGEDKEIKYTPIEMILW